MYGVKKNRGYAYYRYRERKKGYKRIIQIFILTFVFCSLLQGIRYFFIDSYSLDSVSMEPGIENGRRVVVSPLAYGIKNPFTGKSGDFIKKPARGDLVVCLAPHVNKESWAFRLADQYIRLITLQKVSAIYRYSEEWGSPFQVRRIIALPGESVYVRSYEAYISKFDSYNFVSEKVLITDDYTIVRPQVSDGAPLGADAEVISLSGDEYFLMGDNRPVSLDSRTYGLVKRDRIIARVLFSF